MTNLEQIGISNIVIHEGYFPLEPENLIKKGDLICMATLKGEISWLNPDHSEIGKIRKYVGQLVVRKIAL